MTKKIFLKVAGAALLITVFLNSCRQELLQLENDKNLEKNKRMITTLYQDNLESDKSLLKEINKLKKEKFKTSTNSKTIQDSILEGAVIETSKFLLIEEGVSKTYTFPISRLYPNNKIENLILKKNSNNTYSGLLAQYTISEQQKQQFLAGNPINLGSNAKFYRIDNLSISSRVQVDVVGCLEITWETGYCSSGQHSTGNDAGCVVGGAPEPAVLSIVDICDDELGGSSGGGGGSSGGGSPADGGSTGGAGGDSSGGFTNPFNTYLFMSYDDQLLFCDASDTLCQTNWANQVGTVNYFNSLVRNSVLSSYTPLFFDVKEYLIANQFSTVSQDYLTERLNIIGNWYRAQDNLTDEKKLHNFKIAHWIFKLFMEDDTVDIQNFFNRVSTLDLELLQNPNKLLNMPCSQLPQWQTVAQHQVPQALKNKLNNIQGQTNWWDSWEIQNIDNAGGPSINMDLFPVRITTMPNKPNSSQKFTPAEFFEYFRKNINSFVDPDKSQFNPIVEPTYGIDETNLWNSNNPLSALITISIEGDDGTVMCTGYNGLAWVFSTVKAPFNLDFKHPVSGHRLFGYWVDSNGDMFLFTRGVDRFTQKVPGDGLGVLTLAAETFAFSQADKLWVSMQDKISNYVNHPTRNGNSNKVTPVKYRPNYNKIKDYLKGKITLQSLGCN